MTTGDKPAGWYDDPHGHTDTARWWDGSAWTDRTQPLDEDADGPAPPPTPTPAPTPAPAPGVDGRDRRRKRLLAGAASAALVAAIAGYLVVGSDDGEDKPDNVSPTAAAVDPSLASPPAPPPGLVAQWELNQGAADTLSRFHGTTSGNVTWSPEQSGSAFFTGGGSIQTREPVLDLTRSFTIAAWAKVTGTDGNQTVVAQDGTHVSGFSLHYNDDARTWAFARPSDDAAQPAQWHLAVASQPARVGIWTHLVGTYDAAAGLMTLYVDGVPQATAVDPKPWHAAGALTIGRATGGGERLNGSVSDVQAYARVLTPAEITILAAQP